MDDHTGIPEPEAEGNTGQGSEKNSPCGDEFLDRAKARLDQAVEEARTELTQMVEEAREEFEEIREKAPGWVQDARRKVADFLEPDPPT